MNSQIFYEITTHLENPNDCLAYACVSSKYSKFWKECPRFDSKGEYFRVHPSTQETVRFDPRELEVYDRVLGCPSRFISVTGLSIRSPLLLFYCESISAQKELCYFSPYYTQKNERDDPCIIYGNPPNSEAHSVYMSRDIIVFWNPKKKISRPSLIEVELV